MYAAYFAADALPQLAQHFFKQADEEDEHALRFINYVVDVGGRVVIPAIDAPRSQFHSAEEAIKLSPFEVRSEADNSYTATASTTGTRIASDIFCATGRASRSTPVPGGPGTIMRMARRGKGSAAPQRLAATSTPAIVASSLRNAALNGLAMTLRFAIASG